ncbi:hypothetical protein HZH68_011988 [Vespula germanica]|uniref:Uncharacterized protein n=1 Tax=Vespula germanica TaxID=30212 RepID=A0A834JMC0_VESGE|nr:hypothetical protein HZH68_011988 [Vespula germanica]
MDWTYGLSRTASTYNCNDDDEDEQLRPFVNIKFLTTLTRSSATGYSDHHHQHNHHHHHHHHRHTINHHHQPAPLDFTQRKQYGDRYVQRGTPLLTVRRHEI